MKTNRPTNPKYTVQEWNQAQHGLNYNSTIKAGKRCGTCNKRIRGKNHDKVNHPKKGNK